MAGADGCGLTHVALRGPDAVISVLDVGFCRLYAACGHAQRKFWASDLRNAVLHRLQTMVNVSFFAAALGFSWLDHGFLQLDLLILESHVAFLCLT